MSTTIAILSQKGGTGKTTLTRSLSEGLRRAGLSVLAIDADPQGSALDWAAARRG
ncbi:MAG TPA: ParA family protein, partial [Solirubrobacterales bacterium]|nr:ParA family protein [Solirubrobacterales bacterium]